MRLILRLIRISFMLAAICFMQFSSSPTEAAPGSVDTFETAQPLITLTAPGDVGSTTQSIAAGAGILGGERDIEITMTAGTFPGAELSAGAGGGLFAASFDATVQGSVRIEWDGPDGDPNNVDPTGLGGLDLTSGGTQDAFIITIFSDDLPVDPVIEVFTDAGNSSTYTLNLGGGIATPQDLPPIPFSAFTPNLGAGADFTNVGAITLTITSNTQLDLVLDSIGTTSTQPPPPPPPPEDEEEEEEEEVPPPAPSGGDGGPAPTATPEFPTMLPETGQFPPIQDGPLQRWSLTIITLILAVGAGAWLKMRNKDA